MGAPRASGLPEVNAPSRELRRKLDRCHEPRLPRRACCSFSSLCCVRWMRWRVLLSSSRPIMRATLAPSAEERIECCVRLASLRPLRETSATLLAARPTRAPSRAAREARATWLG